MTLPKNKPVIRKAPLAGSLTSMRMPGELCESIRRYAVSTDRSLTAVIRKAIREMFEREGFK